MSSLGLSITFIAGIIDFIDALPLYLKIILFAIVFGILGYIVTKISDSFTISRTIKNIINIYSKERSIGVNHANALDTIIKSQFIFSETKQVEAKNNFSLLQTSSIIGHIVDKYSENKKIESDLRVLSIAVLMVIFKKDYKEYQKKIMKDFDKTYDSINSNK